MLYVVVVTIGFDPPNGIEVSENDGNVTLNVRLFSGILERNISINFSTTDNATASAGAIVLHVHNIIVIVIEQTFAHADIGNDYNRTMIPLIFSPTVHINCPQVPIINDEVNENSENFFVVLAASQKDEPVNIFQGRANIRILDDNDCMFKHSILV